MDFVERIFAISPDGGGGGLEAAILCVLIVASMLAFQGVRAWRRR